MAALTFDELVTPPDTLSKQQGGKVLTFNDEASPDFMARMKTDFNNRVANDEPILDAYSKNQQGPLSTGFQLLGQGAGLANDAAMNGLGSIARYAGDAVGLNTPNAKGITPFDRMTKSTGDAANASGVSSALGSVADKISQGYQYMGDNYPVATRTAEAIGNIANVVPVLGALGKTGELADRGYQAAKDAFQARRLSAVQEMIMPKQTAAEIAENATKYTNEGLLNKRTYNPSPEEIDQAKTVAATGVKPSNPLEDNIQILNTARLQKAKDIGVELGKANTPIDPVVANRNIQAVHDTVMGNEFVKLEGKTAQTLMKVADKAIADNPNTAAGLWQARKDFDAAIKQFQPTVFNTDAPSKAFKFTADQIRNGINQTIIDSTPGQNFGGFLKDYTHLSDAIENMGGKLSQQPANAAARFANTPKGKLLIKAGKYGATAAAGGGAAGAAYGAFSDHAADHIDSLGGE